MLVARGVEHVVMSPGSRNASLMQLLDSSPGLLTSVVVDERSAAFQALGICMITNRPVALVCTSGTALLNYGPAVCEAYYRELPLIVISADRPPEWIDQADSQTMRQPGVMANYTVGGCTVDATLTSPGVWAMNNRLVNETLAKACGRPRGPVHINVHTTGLLDPSWAADEAPTPRLIGRLLPSSKLERADAAALASRIMGSRRVVIVAGQMQPSAALHRSLARFVGMPGVVLVAESVANLHGLGIGPAELFATRCAPDKIDILITIGGAIVSGRLKKMLRQIEVGEHWSVTPVERHVDTYRHLTLTIATDAESFFGSLASAMRRSMPVVESDFSSDARSKMSRAVSRLNDAMFSFTWSDLKAVYFICGELIPSRWNLQVSNGTSVRYMELADTSRLHRVDCNRGVSGIDGSTSTAVGAASVFGDVTVLITGDMSAMYDIGVLLTDVSPRFKMVIIDNGGGGIFTNVRSTRALPSHDKFYTEPVNLPLRQLALAAGFEYFEARQMRQLRSVWPKFAAVADKPAVLHLHGFDSNYSLECLKQIFKNK